MSKTIDFGRVAAAAAVSFVLFAFSGVSNAQTLGELADAQRVKQQAEIAKMRREAAQADLELSVPLKAPPPLAPSAEEAARFARKAAEAAKPRIVVHAVYAKNGAWVAELAEGQRLSLAMVGMQLNGQRVTSIDQRGLQISKPCTAADVREKARCGQRVVALGEAV
ncbi:hypothetical protein ACSFA0_24750 [Variovorax sp. LT1P1]|uniref:hypothetical protein n=1 Tax=Variovorax sp. LT1P1 TaxID=3443730 RepID=UPI003F475DBE